MQQKTTKEGIKMLQKVLEYGTFKEETQVNREQLIKDILSLTNEQAEYVLRRLLCEKK